MPVKRHLAGSPEGGRYAPCPSPHEQALQQQISLDTQTQKQAQDITLNGIDLTSDLHTYIGKEAHAEIAAGQSKVADTAAEFWHSVALTNTSLQDALRGRPRTPLLRLTALDIKLAKSLQKSILSTKLDAPAVVYRGVTTGDNEDPHDATVLLEADIGDTITVDGFWSTSTKPDIAEAFMGMKDGDGEGLILMIETDVGKFLPTSSSHDENGFFLEEWEVVLPHRGQYEILNRKRIQPSKLYAEPVTLISLRYVGTDPEDNTLESLGRVYEYHPSDDEREYKFITKPIRRKMRLYKKARLPVGNQTTDI